MRPFDKISPYFNGEMKFERCGKEATPQSLFFWTLGRPRSEDGKGFRARVKLRVAFELDKANVARRGNGCDSSSSDSSCSSSNRSSNCSSNGSSAGVVGRRAWLLLDRPYGAANELMSHFGELRWAPTRSELRAFQRCTCQIHS